MKIVVAIALGLGTMIGWKRIVVTVGEKIGKTHLTYAQGACAEITAAATIAAADIYGLPVSTTHVLSSGIAGTMAASGSGLQWSTIRNIALAWVLTLPAAMILSSFRVFFSFLFGFWGLFLKPPRLPHPPGLFWVGAPKRCKRRHAASVFSTSLIQYDVPNTIASSLKL